MGSFEQYELNADAKSRAYQKIQWYMENLDPEIAVIDAIENGDIEVMKELLYFKMAKLESRESFESRYASIPDGNKKDAIVYMLQSWLNEMQKSREKNSKEIISLHNDIFGEDSKRTLKNNLNANLKSNQHTKKSNRLMKNVIIALSVVLVVVLAVFSVFVLPIISQQEINITTSTFNSDMIIDLPSDIDAVEILRPQDMLLDDSTLSVVIREILINDFSVKELIGLPVSDIRNLFCEPLAIDIWGGSYLYTYENKMFSICMYGDNVSAVWGNAYRFTLNGTKLSMYRRELAEKLGERSDGGWDLTGEWNDYAIIYEIDNLRILLRLPNPNERASLVSVSLVD